MKQLSILALGAALLSLVACSDSSDDKPAQPVADAPAQQTQQQPAGKQLNPAQQKAVDDAKGMAKQGTVKELLHASGYTYMDIDIGDGKSVWIAAATMRAKKGNTVKWTDAAVMRDFNSKSLHRTFAEILFVSNASVVQ